MNTMLHAKLEVKIESCLTMKIKFYIKYAGQHCVSIYCVPRVLCLWSPLAPEQSRGEQRDCGANFKYT